MTTGAHAEDAALADRLATEVGQLLVRTRAEHLAAGGPDGPELEDVGDRTAQALIAEVLDRERPGDAVLSEEARDDPARVGAPRVWIVDPLDGTREYGQGRHDWAVHIALWADGDLRTGAVALPDEGETYLAGDRHVPERSGGQRLRFAISRTRPSRLVDAVVGDLDGVRVPHGSAGYKAMVVVRGDADAYLHTGGQQQWDSAAPVIVARAAGLHTSRADGTPLAYNVADTWLPDLLIARPETAPTILDAVRRAGR